MATLQQPVNKGRPNPPAPEQVAQAQRAARGRRPGGWPLFVRLLISLLVSWHLLAVFMAPLSVSVDMAPKTDSEPPMTTVLAQHPPMQWYLDALYLNHGYHFFAPDPPEGHLIHFQVLDERGSVIKEGQFPSKTDQWPRLRYHRYFMLADQCSVPAPTEAAAKQWQQAFLRSYARELLREYGGQSVRVQRITHFPLFRQDALKNMPLDDPHTYKTEMEVVQRRQDLELPAPTQNGAYNQLRRDVASGWQGERR
ncbi:MAG TPA: hypothetical protein VGM76_11605 [Lacipirellulaceae bacterium]